MQTYIVKAGDTLYGISRQFGVSAEEIRKTNNLNSNVLSIGEVLKIPTKETTALYIVVKGDSLWSIAKKYNTSVSELTKLNNLQTTNLVIGQEIRIPINGKVEEIDNNKIDYSVPNGASCYGTGYVEPTYITYKVKVGDSLYKIAKKYNTTTDKLIKLNNLTNSNLSIGQILKIKEDRND